MYQFEAGDRQLYDATRSAMSNMQTRKKMKKQKNDPQADCSQVHFHPNRSHREGLYAATENEMERNMKKRRRKKKRCEIKETIEVRREGKGGKGEKGKEEKKKKEGKGTLSKKLTAQSSKGRRGDANSDQAVKRKKSYNQTPLLIDINRHSVDTIHQKMGS